MAEGAKDSGIKLSRQVITIKAAAIVLGLLILILAIAAGWSNVSSVNEETTLEAEMIVFLNNLAIYDSINAYNEPLVNHFDVVKLSSITSSDIQGDLEPEYDFIIEIIDVSPYSESFTFSEGSGNSIKTSSSGSYEVVLVQQRAAALILGDETHAAILKVTMMA